MTSAQLAELIALTTALELGTNKRVNIYTDSKYAYQFLLSLASPSIAFTGQFF